jgi:heptosyltransferase III
LERWIEFGQRITPAFGSLLLIGGEADQEILDKIQLQWRGLPMKMMIQKGLPELASALGECTAFVGHDTGITHLAAAVQTPTVALFGPTDPEIWRPLGDHVKVIRGAEERMDTISVMSVVEAVENISWGKNRT